MISELQRKADAELGYDEPVEIVAGAPLRLSVDSMNALKKATGRGFGDLTQDDEDESLRFQMLAFVELYRRARPPGFNELGAEPPDASELWERAAHVELSLLPAERSDPTSGVSSKTLQSFAATGE